VMGTATSPGDGAGAGRGGGDGVERGGGLLGGGGQGGERREGGEEGALSHDSIRAVWRLAGSLGAAGIRGRVAGWLGRVATDYRNCESFASEVRHTPQVAGC
jgi:hypothetical protein